jgi:hypothetical protein
MGVFKELIKDIEARDKKGFEEYGKEMEINDGRDSIQDLYEELLDACAYIKKFMMERDNNK